MKLSLCALSLSCAIVWGLGIFLVGLANLAWHPYGEAFLKLLDSVYPGYHYTGTFSSVLVATGYGLVDGLVAGAVFATLYNAITGCKHCRRPVEGPAVPK